MQLLASIKQTRLPWRHEPTMMERIIERIPMDRIAERLPDRVADRLPFRHEPESKLRRAAPFAGAAAAGAALAYFFDPQQGRGRRSKTKDMIAGRVRRTARKAERRSRYVSGKAYGLRQRAAHRMTGSEGDMMPDDVTLTNKVMSEVLRDPDYDKTRVVVNAENGIVVLRGELDRPDQIKKLEKTISAMPGVAGVENLLHLKGTPAPNKREAIDASRR